jgi:hypothetical protein
VLTACLQELHYEEAGVHDVLRKLALYLTDHSQPGLSRYAGARLLGCLLAREQEKRMHNRFVERVHTLC